jgi:hypothetical protein
MLSFEIVNDGKAIQICCDREGLETLVQALERARQLGHLHLRAPSAGGRALNDQTPSGDRAIGEVVITTGGDDWPDVPDERAS